MTHPKQNTSMGWWGVAHEGQIQQHYLLWRCISVSSKKTKKFATPCLCTALGMHAAHMNKKPKKLHKKFRHIYQSPWSLPNSLTHSLTSKYFLIKRKPNPNSSSWSQRPTTTKTQQVNPSSTALQITRNTYKLFTPQKTETHKSFSKTPLPKSQEHQKTQNHKHMSKQK